MALFFPLKGSLHLFRWFLLLSIVFYSISTVAKGEVEDVPSPERMAISKLMSEISVLTDNAAQMRGEEYEAIQLQLFHKNQLLRDRIAIAIDNKALPTAELVALVKKQQQHSAGSMRYLESQILSLNEEINRVKGQDKLPLVNNSRELQQYLFDSYESSWENLQWLEVLGEPDQAALNEFKGKLDNRMRLLSASVGYLSQQQKSISAQVAMSPESEKPALQINELVVDLRLNIVTNSLRELLPIGDALTLETSEYKRQIFEVTGSITYDLLNLTVVLSIIDSWSSAALEWLLENAPQHVFKLLIFLLILLLTRAVSKLTKKAVSHAVSTKNLSISKLMQDFFISMSGKAVWVIGILVGLSQIGINLTPILTGFGIAGVIIGFALQDTMSNFAAGMMLLIYRPFDVGDFVYAGGVDGKVSHMSLVNTTIRTFDNQIIIVPNSKIWGDVIKNVTHERVRRVDMIFGIGYADDLLKAEAVLNDIVATHPAVLRSPEPLIKVQTLNTSSVDFIVRPWVKTDDYWDVYWDVTKEVKLRFDREGITIPFPQQDVHLHVANQPESEAKSDEV
ncbi:mechanosensitive ion channel family protein [Thaumasiovibrio subtropicus]|uniref:mechanosensitive ion channel family protein n=1 Tax=Thaumasiovibrio subtropicus TaxID=1891207 RepID=UPI000B35DB51|nr:mechanosensitive ion channel family protein [Thaumasiovibrio subtropicus]